MNVMLRTFSGWCENMHNFNYVRFGFLVFGSGSGFLCLIKDNEKGQL